ncbi:delta(3,5)-Delta(2,4)-dienoyl-CoA isomerase, mitochondrial isoform X1 [Apteryx rowi]|uniref:delta(3,5)-Delta(2,4)-dienoyl-CoA isomerase, mitochondrial isoform X1 n=1 Tax=Apteryx rowi TaxID=308060 RepID=UPI000E1D8149|nr:delta(3,5)-Delta(2,4)-dienoyl-CoA isomerase, mitochondrial isoform X1 [Apteryx rowi]
MAAAALGLRGLLGRPLGVPAGRMAAGAGQAAAAHSYETLRVTPARERVLHVELHRPDKRNAMNAAFWREMVECFRKISQDPSCHAVVISGAGKVFTAVPQASDRGGAWRLRRRRRRPDLRLRHPLLQPGRLVPGEGGGHRAGGRRGHPAASPEDRGQPEPGERAGLHRAQDDGPRGPELRLGEPGVPRQGDAVGGRPGPGGHRGHQEPRGRAGHQGEPGVRAGPPRPRGPALHRHLEHEHAADRGHPQAGAGGAGEEGPRGRGLRQAVGTVAPRAAGANKPAPWPHVLASSRPHVPGHRCGWRVGNPGVPRWGQRVPMSPRCRDGDRGVPKVGRGTKPPPSLPGTRHRIPARTPGPPRAARGRVRGRWRPRRDPAPSRGQSPDPALGKGPGIRLWPCPPPPSRGGCGRGGNQRAPPN